MSLKSLDGPRRSSLFLRKCDQFSLRTCNCAAPVKRRCLSSSASSWSSVPPVTRQDGGAVSEEGKFHPSLGHRARQKLADKEFFLSLLSSVSTKREANSYLSRFKSHHPAHSKPHHNAKKGKPSDETFKSTREFGAGLSGSVASSRVVDESHLFNQEPVSTSSQYHSSEVSEKLHLALVKVMAPQQLDDPTIQGIGVTLSQLTRLGMGCCVVIDTGPVEDATSWRECAIEQADRLSAAIDANFGPGSRRLDSAVVVSSLSPVKPSILSRKLLLSPLRRGRIVVIVPIGYTQDTQVAVPVQADDVVLALAKELAGLGSRTDSTEDPEAMARRINKLQKEVSLDRLIVLDPLGGIPAPSRQPHKSHVFVNLEQEYDDIVTELTQGVESIKDSKSDKASNDWKTSVSSLGRSNHLSQFVESGIMSLRCELQLHRQLANQNRDSVMERHLRNLRLLQRTLSYLPASSSGIITTPQDAANSARTGQDNSLFSAVGTRRQRNPLIHNLLTDKPPHSSSLPLGRLGVKNGAVSHVAYHITPSTFVKKGVPLTVLPDPQVRLWTAANDGQARMKLDDPRIDLARLIHLIEDSFGRKLDASHYMDRIKDRLAGLIIAGEYEGGAILTWETPPGVPDDGSDASLSRMVPYLDKFAVLRRSQGAGGVADIVFNAMVRSCFPKGVCWRSRRDNPVNKWYFERARGTWKLPGTNWTMFWTTEGVPENQQVFWDYEGVCRDIEPSWADNKSVVD